MKLSEFLILPDELQYQAVWECGVHIDNIIYNSIDFQLYAICDFYVEVLYDATNNKIISKNAFQNGNDLDKYLERLPFFE